MPPAVLRSRAPRPRPSRPTAVRYSALPSTARNTPGSPRPVPRFWADRTDWPARNDTSRVGTDSTTVVRPNVTALPHNSCSRPGTAARLTRIDPVAYSPVMNSTPRTPIANCASCTPARLTEAESNVAGSAGGRATRSVAYASPTPTTSTTRASRHQNVDGSERRFGHPQRVTRTRATGRSPGEAGRGTVGLETLPTW